MIITLTGRIAHKGANYVVIETGGVGYQIQLGKPSLMALPLGLEIKVWTHEHIRDDSRELYGFLTSGERDLFLELIDISGVGPKAALSILELGSASQVEDAIERGDIDFLSSAVGIGKKTSQKIILELRGRLVTGDSTDSNEEVLAALVSLGYNRDAAREALKRIGSDGSVEDRLRAALRELGR
jgi:Holliday junction DNA helicase RuvA